MNALKITMTVPLGLLTPVGVDTYSLVIKLYDSLGAPLVSPYVGNVHTVTVTTVVNTFFVTIPVADATYTISNVKFKAFANNDSNCCFDELVYTITNTESETPPSELLIGGYFG